MDPLIIGGIIAGVSALGSAIYSGISSSKAADKANAQSVALMREQNAFNASMMREQNAYNSYSAQVQRAQEAGLNPSFLFQSGGTSQAAAPATGVAVPDIKQSNFGQSFIDQLYKNTSLVKDIKKNEADIKKEEAETETIKVANSTLDSRLKAELEKIKTESNKNEAEKVKYEEDAKVSVAHTKELYMNVEQMSESINLMKAQSKHLGMQDWQITRTINNETKKVNAEIERLAHENALTDQQASLTKLTLKKVYNEIGLQLKEGRQMDASWMAQTIENALNSAKAELEMNDIEIRLGMPAYDQTVRHTSGLIGSVINTIGMASNAFNYSGASERAHKRLDNFFQGQASWSNAH